MTYTILRDVRENAGIIGTDLAKEANVSRPTLESAEKGIPIRRTSAARIVNTLNAKLGTHHTIESLGIVLIQR